MQTGKKKLLITHSIKCPDSDCDWDKNIYKAPMNAKANKKRHDDKNPEHADSSTIIENAFIVIKEL